MSLRVSRQGARSKEQGAGCRSCHRLLAPCFLLLFLLLSACQRTPPVVKIGLVAPFEGRHRAVGYDVIYSARLAVREINAAGGIGGYRVALVALDDGGDVEMARETAVSLTKDPAVVAVIGHWRADTTAIVTPVYADAGLLFLPIGEETAPVDLAESFVEKYTAVAPLNEEPGIYAAPTYATFQTLWQTLEEAHKNSKIISRTTVLTTIYIK